MNAIFAFMNTLILKAQSNHFVHLDIDMKEEMKNIREDTTKEIRSLREDLSRFMFWSLGLSVSSTLFILGFMKLGLAT